MDKIYSRKRIKFFTFKDKNSLKKNKRFFKIIFIIVIAIVTSYVVILGINPIIDKQCENIAKVVATKISNEEVSFVMKNYNYEDLCIASKDQNGNITLISTNVVNVNDISSNIALRIQEALNNKNNSIFYIPIGSFLGSKFLSGRGPNVEMKMTTIGNVETSLKSEFISSGINQTLHKIYLEVVCNVIILTPFNSIEEKIVNQVLIAEAVIVGITPNTYYNLEGLDNKEKVDIIE